MNDATRQFIEQMKAKRAAEAEAKAEKKRKKEAAKERSRQQIKDYAEQRKQRNRQRSIEQRSEAVIPAPSRSCKLTPEQVSQIGEPIAGSNLVRDFCVACGEPIRVAIAGIENTCLDCNPTGKPGSVDNASVTNGMKYHGGQFHSGEW